MFVINRGEVLSMTKLQKKTVFTLIWCNLIGVLLYAFGTPIVSYLTSTHEGTVGAWQFLFAVIGLCLFGYGLTYLYETKGTQTNHGLIMGAAWLSIIAGVLGFIYTFIPTSLALGIISAVIALVAFICALMLLHK